MKSKIYFNQDKRTTFRYFENHKDTVEAIFRQDNDSLSHMTRYYINGNQREIGRLYRDSLKIGKWKSYEKNGILKDVSDYLTIEGKSYLNQRWVFSSEGDTIGGNYFELKMKDTVNFEESNRFHFFLKEPLLSYESNSFILLPTKSQKLKKDFSNHSNITWDTIHSIGTKNKFNEKLKSRNHDIILDVFSKEKGANHLIGLIVERSISDKDSIDFITRNIYFNIPYYVR